MEVKYGDAPGVTKSTRITLEDLPLERPYVVYPGDQAYLLDAKISVVPLSEIRAELARAAGVTRARKPARSPSRKAANTPRK